VVVSRRSILQGAAAGGFTALTASKSLAVSVSQTRAVLFDAFAIFDPRTVALAAQNALGDRSAEFLRIWRTKQFEYTWLRNAGGVYQNFWDVTADALGFAEQQLGLRLQPDIRQSLLDSYLNLQPWPDVPAGIAALQSNGLKLGILSDFTDAMLDSNLKNADLKLDVLLSTDRVRRFKPDPQAYAMGQNALNLPRDEITYVAFAGWDAVGAVWFGYRTFWLNRLRAVEEHLNASISATGAQFEDLVKFLSL
jgi:2-haloacid dehalogenase